MKTVRSTKRTTTAVAPTLEALRLLGLWTRLAQGHIALGQGCVCGAGFGSVQVIDFERDILDFLRGRHPSAQAVLGEDASINGLLREIAAAKPPLRIEAAAATALLTDLATSIGSFEAAHLGR